MTAHLTTFGPALTVTLEFVILELFRARARIMYEGGPERQAPALKVWKTTGDFKMTASWSG